jgi:hypothetical protein
MHDSHLISTVRKDGKRAGIGLPAKKSGTGTGCRLGTAHQPNGQVSVPDFHILQLRTGATSASIQPRLSGNFWLQSAYKNGG